MRNVANGKKAELRAEQFKVLVDIISGMKNRNDLELFLNNFLTASEMSYLEQRLDIMRMLAKGFSYNKIKEKLASSISAINNAQNRLTQGGEQFARIILAYKYLSLIHI